MKKSFMTRALATGLSLAMAFSMAAATNVTTASAASKPAMITSAGASAKSLSLKVGEVAKIKVNAATKANYKVSAAKASSKRVRAAVVGSTVVAIRGLKATVTGKPSTVKVSFKSRKTNKTSKFTYSTKVTVTAAEAVVEALTLTEVKQIASNQIKVVFSKDASAIAKDAYKISATDGTKEIGVKAVTYSEDGKSALIDTYMNVDNGVTYTVTAGELTKDFTASVGEVASISISTANAQQNVKTPINFTLFDANGIDVTPSVNVDATCVITLTGSYVTAEKDKASNASVTMGTVGGTVEVTITYNKGVAGSESVSAKQTITCVGAGQTLGNAVFATTSTVNAKSKCAKFYLGLSDKVVTLKKNNSTSDVYFCAKDNNGDVISYDKYAVESSNDDVATVTVTKDSGKYMQVTVHGNSVGSANLNVSASKNGVVTNYSIPVTVSEGTTAVKMVATAKRPVMSNVIDNDYEGKIEAKLLDANGKEVPGYFTYKITQIVAKDKPQISLTKDADTTPVSTGTTSVKAGSATAGVYSVKVTGSENADMSCAFEQPVQIVVKDLPKEAYESTGAGIKVAYQIELSEADVDENPSLSKLKNSTKVKLYATYDGLFAGYVNKDGGVSDTPATAGAITGNLGIRVASESAISGPAVTVKFGNQYYKNTTPVVNLYNPGANAAVTTITSGGMATYGANATDGAVDVTINSVSSGATIAYGDVTSKGALLWTDVARTGTYTVEYYYYDVEGNFTDKPITQNFTVKNTLTLPTVKVLSKKVVAFDEPTLKKVMKASVDMNNNVSDYESIDDLTNGVGEVNASAGITSADGLKTTYKYAVVLDNFKRAGTTDQTWRFYIPINTTFSYQ